MAELQPIDADHAALVPLPTGVTIDGLELAHVSTDMLRSELARGLTLTADTLTRLGLVWQELERRGEDLSDLKRGIARTLPLIAAGRLAAEAVVAYAGRPALLRALEGVPLNQQRRYAAGEPIEVIDPSDPSSPQRLPLAALPAAVVRVVLSDGRVRSLPEQRLAFRPRRLKPAEPSNYRYQPKYDPAAGTIAVGRMTIRLTDLLAELSSAAGPDHPPADVPKEYDIVRVRLTHDEFRRYSATCNNVGLPDWEMARKALRAFGLI